MRKGSVGSITILSYFADHNPNSAGPGFLVTKIELQLQALVLHLMYDAEVDLSYHDKNKTK